MKSTLFSPPLRFTAAITLFFFTWTNIAGAEEWQGLLAEKNQPTLSADADTTSSQKLPIPSELSHDFLEDTLSLTNAEENLTAPEATDFSFKPEDEQLYLDPEQFVAKGPGGVLKEVTKDNQGKISQVKTQTHVFDYTYAVDGKLAKIAQSKLVAEQQISGGNLAAGILPTASSYYVDANYHPSYATDGKLGDTGAPSWGGANADGSQDWLQVDLGAAKNIGALKYDTRFHSYFGNDIWQSSFKISGSLDGINWFLLTEKDNLTAPQLFTLLFEPKQVRYLKVHDIMSHYSAFDWWHFAYANEIQAFETVPTGNTSIVMEKEYRYSYNAENQIEKISEGADKEFVYERDAEGKILKIQQNTILQKDPEKNILAGIAPAVSSTYDPVFSAANATDGKLGNDPVIGWAGSSIDGSGEWLQVDLGSAKSIDHLKYDTRYNPSYGNSIWQSSFKISGSLDGVNWFLLTEKNGLTTPQLFDLTFNATTLRYLKVHDIVSHYPLLGDWWHFAYVQEIQAFEVAGIAEKKLEKEFVFDYDAQGKIQRLKTSSPGLPEAPVVNLGRGILPTVSSTSQYEAVRATDGLLGNEAVGWTGANADGSQDWLQLDLGSTQTINKLRYDTRFHPFFGDTIWQSSFKISGSLDGVNWFLLTEKSGLTTPQLFDLTFNPIQARYVRVHDIHSHYPGFADWWHFAYVNELEVYRYNPPPAAPEVTLTSPLLTNNASLSQLDFTVDGNAVTRTIPALNEGENLRVLHFESSPGYQTDYFARVTLDTTPQPSEAILEDGTHLFYQGGILNKERTPEGDEVFYHADGSVSHYKYADGQEIRYLADKIEIASATGTLIEALTIPQALALNESQALKVTLEGGIEAYYIEGQPVEFRTASGIRITSFTLNAASEIESALLIYPDGTKEIIREKTLLRRILPDGTILDFTPKGFTVREIAGATMQYYAYKKLSQTKVSETRIFTQDGSFSRYDELGILREVKGNDGKHFVYDRQTIASGYKTTLNANVSSAAQPKSLVEAEYTNEGVLKQMKFQDGSQILFENGKVSRALNPDGTESADYSYLENTGLDVERSGNTFRYDQSGFLQSITTSQGTITREAEDSDGDGQITDEAVKLLLETVGGDKLSDFELDSEGKIINGIIETKEGIKQTITNGVLTRFETVDGKIYDFLNNEAILKEWHFKDGTRVLYGGGNITEVIFPGNKRLHTLGFNAKKEIQSFVEESANGTKYFENNKLVKLITPAPASSTIYYGSTGLAERIVLSDTSEEKLEYKRDAQGAIQEITFKGEHTSRTFTADGTLLSLLTGGVSAEIENGTITQLATRFATVQTPVFSTEGSFSGEKIAADGSRQIIQNGELVQIIRPNGTEISYENGRVSLIKTPKALYRLIHEMKDGELEIRLRFESQPGMPEMLLTSYLLETENDIPQEDAGESFVQYGQAVVQSTEKKIGSGAMSLDGNGDYVSVPDSSAFDLGASDFAMETWIKLNAMDGYHIIAEKLSGTSGYSWYVGPGGILTFYGANGALQLNSYPLLTVGEWHHVSVSRTGNVWKLFINGSEAGSLTGAYTLSHEASDFRIGSRNGTGHWLNGYVDEFRLTKGTQTSLLLHFDLPQAPNSIIDEDLIEVVKVLSSYDSLDETVKSEVSTSGGIFSGDIAFVDGSKQIIQGGQLIQTILPSGTKVNYFFGRIDKIETATATYQLLYSFESSFGPSDNPIMCGLLISCLTQFPFFANGRISNVRIQVQDSTGTKEYDLVNYLLNPEPPAAQTNTALPIITAQGNTHLDTTQPKLGSANVIFDGAKDYFEIPDSNDLDFGAGEFTIDFWFKLNSAGIWQAFYGHNNTEGGDYDMQLYADPSNRIGATFSANGTNQLMDLRGTTSVTTEVWHHYAVVRNGDNFSIYLDGALEASGTSSSALHTSSSKVTFGRFGEFDYYYMKGQLDEIRISKGVARWTSNFTPSAQNYTADPATKLLLHLDGLQGSQNILSNSYAEIEQAASAKRFEEIKSILLPRPLYDSFQDRSDVTSDFGSQEIQYAKLIEDSERAKVYSLSDSYTSYWGMIDGSRGGIEKHSILSTTWMGMPDKFTDMIDMNGDGLPDRVAYDPANRSAWWVQLNNGQGFDTGFQWQGVNADYYYSYGVIRSPANASQQILADLLDINGDKRADRVIQKRDGSEGWFVQLNNGRGFDPVKAWEGTVQEWLPATSSQGKYASEARDNGYQNELVVDLIDMDGDGLQDRIIRPYAGDLTSWQFQKNTGTGFEEAVAWRGVDINFNVDPKAATALSWYVQADNTELHPVSVLFKQKYDALYALTKSGGGCSKGCLTALQSAIESAKQALEANGFTRFTQQLSDWPWGNFGPAEILQARLTTAINQIQAIISDQTKLIDMNGDKLPDRVLLKSNTGNPLGPQTWYVQLNNGHGFDPMTLWDDQVREIPGITNLRAATGIRVFNGYEWPRTVVADLVDVTGDGRPDRVTLQGNSHQAPQNTWWVEVNNGQGFETAVAWTNIAGNDNRQTSITQDSENFQSWSNFTSPANLEVVSRLLDINGDKILDRVIAQDSSQWTVQLGTGSGYLPVTTYKIEGLTAPTTEAPTARFDYLHVSLKAATAIPSTSGNLKVMLGDPSDPDSYQEWTIDALDTSWKDFYLPLSKNKSNADKVKIELQPAGSSLNVPFYVADVTFVALRPKATKDWLDRMLGSENVFEEIHSERTQTLAQYLGLREATDATSFDFSKLLTAETRIQFNQEGETEKFKTFYGEIVTVEDGKILQSELPDGSVIHFDGAASQTVTHAGSTETETLHLSYGRVRKVDKGDGVFLEYTYEFDAQGNEVTVVYDPSTQMRERYQDNRILSRMRADGVMTSFEYDAKGELVHTSISYKGKTRASFDHFTSLEGHKTIVTAEGIREEYDAAGKILFHTTVEGYRYKHSIEQAQRVEPNRRVLEVPLPDGTVFKVEVPFAQLVPDNSPTAEEVHRVELVDYTAPSGEIAGYEDGELVSVSYSGTKIDFDRMETVEVPDEETGNTKTLLKLLDARVHHTDGTVTEYKNGVPFAIVSALGKVISLQSDGGHLIDPAESRNFHFGQAQKLWNDLVEVQWNEFQLPAIQQVAIEYNKAGTELVTREFAEGIVEIYDQGKLKQVLGDDGEELVRYSYDENGNPTGIHMGSSRRRLESSVLELRANVAVENQKALLQVAGREIVINQTIEGQYVVARDQLFALRAQLENERNKLASQKIKGKQAKALVSGAMAEIEAGFDQINQAIEKLAQERSNALAELSKQVRDARTSIENETTVAYTKIELENLTIRKNILKQEITPVVHHWYRQILGRDPSDIEYNKAINSANYETGAFNLQELVTDLTGSDELKDREKEVQDIKDKVEDQLKKYIAKSQAEKIAYAETLRISAEDLVPISLGESEAILEWLLTRSLHFGQSAYLSLEGMLSDAEIEYDRIDLASRLILIDILTGVITPLEDNDLLISMEALQTVAKGYHLNLQAMKITYEGLKAMYEEACDRTLSVERPLLSCGFQLTAHINGNHYILVTGFELKARTESREKRDAEGQLVLDAEGKPIFEEVEILDKNGKAIYDERVLYTDPGAGPETQLAKLSMMKEEFQDTWHDPRQRITGTVGSGPESLKSFDFGYVISPRGPPAAAKDIRDPDFNSSQNSNPLLYSLLTRQERQEIRGAFFGFIKKIFQKIFEIIKLIITTIINVVREIVKSVIESIKTFFQGLGDFFVGLFTFDFKKMLGGLKKIFIDSTMDTVNGLARAVEQSFKMQDKLLDILGAPKFVRRLVHTGQDIIAIVSFLPIVSAHEDSYLSPKTVRTLMAGAKIVAGVALLFVPGGQAFGIGLIAGGTGDILNLHTNLSPEVKQLITIGASVIGVLAGGFFDTGSMSGALSALKSALPTLAKDLASVGVMALGEHLGLDPRLASLLSIPVRAIVGSGVDYLANGPSDIVVGFRDDGSKIFVTSSGGLLSHIKNAVFSQDTAKKILGFGLDLANNEVAEKLNVSPILTSLALRGITGAVVGLMTSGSNSSVIESMIKGAFGGIIKSVADIEKTILNDPLIMLNFITTQNFGDFLEQNAASIFNRGSVEDFLSTYSNIKTAYQQARQRAQTVQINGRQVFEVKMDHDVILYVEEQTDGKTNVKRANFGDRILEGEIRILEGNLVVLDGVETKRLADGTVQMTVYKWNAQTHSRETLQIQTVGDVQIEQYGLNGKPLKFNSDGTIKEGVIENFTSGTRTIIEQDTIRVEKYDLVKNPFGKNNQISYFFYQPSNEVSYEVYDKQGNLLKRGREELKDFAGKERIVIGKPESFNVEEAQTSANAIPINQEQLMESVEKILKGQGVNPNSTLTPEIKAKMQKIQAALNEMGQKGGNREEFKIVLKSYLMETGTSPTVIADFFNAIDRAELATTGKTVGTPNIEIEAFDFQVEATYNGEAKKLEVKMKTIYDSDKSDNALGFDPAQSKVVIKSNGVSIESKTEFRSKSLVSPLIDYLGLDNFGLAAEQFTEVRGAVESKGISAELASGHMFIHKPKDSSGNMLYNVESGIQTSLGTDNKRQLQMKVSIKDIPLFQGNDYLKQQIDFTVGVGRSDGEGESREKIKSGIINQLESINGVIVGQGTILPGFNSHISALADELTNQVIAYQAADQAMSNLPTGVAHPSLSDMENIMRNYPDAVYLPGLLG